MENKSNENRINSDKIIKKLNKSFKGMKERFKNPKSDFSQITELFIDSLYQAYTINDIDLNYRAMVAHREVVEVLENKLYSSRREDERYRISKFLFEIRGIMNTFTEQSSRLYR